MYKTGWHLAVVSVALILPHWLLLLSFKRLSLSLTEQCWRSGLDRAFAVLYASTLKAAQCILIFAIAVHAKRSPAALSGPLQLISPRLVKLTSLVSFAIPPSASGNDGLVMFGCLEG